MFSIKNKVRYAGKSAGGFTMLEMMIIIVIIGILAAIAVPSFSSIMPKLRVRSDARGTMNYLRLARSMAISEGAQVGVYVDTVNRRYFIFKDTISPAMMTYNDGDSVMVGPEILDADVALFSSTFANNSVIFMSTGSASQSGNFVFAQSDGSNQYTVSVLGSTGRSKMQ